MNRHDALAAARAMLGSRTERLAEVLREQQHLERPIGGGSTWSVREAAVHLVLGAGVYADFAVGVPSPVTTLDPAAIGAWNERRNADVAESDPGALADLLVAAARRFLDRTAGWSARQPASWHGGVILDLTDLTTLLGAEVLLHGHDIAVALDAPWQIEPEEAIAVLRCYLTRIPTTLHAVATLLSSTGRLAGGEAIGLSVALLRTRPTG